MSADTLQTTLQTMADTTSHAAHVMHVRQLFTGSREFSEFIERWHDFFLLSGTAAVTLVGLLFVALSIHLDVLIHEKRSELLGLARLTLGTFVVVMAVSIVMLAPFASELFIGMTILIFGALWTVLTLSYLFSLSRRQHIVEPRRIIRRSLFPLIGFLLIAFVGWLLLHGKAWAMFYLIGTFCMLLSNAAATSWDLIVQVGKLKNQEAEEERRAHSS